MTLLPQSSVRALCSSPRWHVFSRPRRRRKGCNHSAFPGGASRKFLPYILGLLIIWRGASFALDVKQKEASAQLRLLFQVSECLTLWMPSIKCVTCTSLKLFLCSQGQSDFTYMPLRRALLWGFLSMHVGSCWLLKQDWRRISRGIC